MERKSLIPLEKIDRAILIIRGQKVMLDNDLAEIYGVKTSRLNEQVKRNKNRFPEDFMFQLTNEEKQEVIANCDHLEKLKFSRTNPYAFTEHGTIMLANVLNTATAVETSVLIVRAFVKLRELLSTHKELERKILELESKYDKQFKIIFKAIRELMHQEQLDKNRPKIGYKIGKEK
ncbi:MAG: ORF6N domain-containing protein [Bacteroidetes bacterium]|nr:ORF6N domain-containing protein [Bacteroidota bacterium]